MTPNQVPDIAGLSDPNDGKGLTSTMVQIDLDELNRIRQRASCVKRYEQELTEARARIAELEAAQSTPQPSRPEPLGEVYWRFGDGPYRKSNDVLVKPQELYERLQAAEAKTMEALYSAGDFRNERNEALDQVESLTAERDRLAAQVGELTPAHAMVGRLHEKICHHNTQQSTENDLREIEKVFAQQQATIADLEKIRDERYDDRMHQAEAVDTAEWRKQQATIAELESDYLEERKVVKILRDANKIKQATIDRLTAAIGLALVTIGTTKLAGVGLALKIRELLEAALIPPAETLASEKSTAACPVCSGDGFIWSKLSSGKLSCPACRSATPSGSSPDSGPAGGECEPAPTTDLSSIIKQLRLKNGFGLREFSEAVEIEPGHYARIEKGQHVPTDKEISQIISGLACYADDVAWLLREWRGYPQSSSAAVTAGSDGPAASESSLEQHVRDLIDRNAQHVRKGTVLGRETWGIVLQHLRSEVHELETATRGTNKENILAELGDVLGLVVHAILKAGFTVSEVEQREIEKLKERFPPAPPSPPADPAEGSEP